MNFVTSLLLVALLSNVLAFPITGSKTSVRSDQHRLYSSEDRIEGNHPESTHKVANNGADDTRALSGLLGEMFEANLEMSREKKQLESLVSRNSDMPVLGTDGIYRIVSQNQLENFKAANADKLVFLKFSSPICAACRMLRQKFQTLHRSPKFADKPVVFADIVISNNKKVADPFRDYITTQLQVRRIPSIHFYAGGSEGLVDQIFCDEKGGCSWPKIQQQMLDFIGQYHTPTTVHNVSSAGTTTAAATIQPAAATATATTTAATEVSKRRRIQQIMVRWLK